MRDKCALHFVLCLLLHSSSNADDATSPAETDTQTDIDFCQRTSSAGLGRTRLSFLKHVVGTYSLLLYVSVWTDSKQLVECAIHYDPIVSVNYLSLCRGERSESQVEVSHFNISLLLSPGSPCALQGPADGLTFTNPKEDIEQLEPRHQHSEAKSRRKRAWILFPGTLWCGTGTRAIDYDQLGMFEHGDRCCREHDHCNKTIPAFTVNYGVFNSNLFTVSHCDCDQRFRQCLMDVNDTISNMVGYSFFNILKMPCFEFKLRRQCTELNWWGKCKVAKEAPYAVFKNPSVYNITRTTSRKGDTSDFQTSADTGGLVTATASTSPIRKVTRGRRPKPSRSCARRGPPRGDTFQLKHRRGKGCRDRKTSQTQITTPSTQTTASLIQRTASLTKQNVYTTQRTASKANTKTSQAKRTKTSKKKTSSRSKITASLSHRSPAPLPKTTHPQQRTTATTQRTTLTMLKAAPQPLTTLTTITSTPKSPKIKARHHCGHRGPPRGDTFQPRRLRGGRRKACLEKIAALLTPTLPSTSKTVSLTQRTIAQTQRTMPSNKKTIPPTKMTSSTLSRTTIAKMSTSSKLRTKPLIQTTAFPAASGSLKQRSSPSTWVNTVEESISTDNLLLCGTLKHLDECKYKIPPLEKRYDLQNMESKTMYHCDCTNRLADQIRSFKTPNILHSLLKDFVSLSCFKDPSLKNCPEGKSCAAGFSKATDLLQALKNMEKRRTLKVQSTSKDLKRGTPFRLYKRCLRIVEPEKLNTKH